MLTTIHSIDTPITDLIFPTVTVCQEPLTPPNPWLYLRPIMEFMHYDCNTSGSCPEIDFLKCNFNFLPSILYRDIDKYANKLRDEEIQILIDPMNLTNALLHNLTNLTYLNGQLLSSFFDYKIPTEYFEKKLIFPPTSLNQTACASELTCNASFKSAKQFIYKTEIFLGKNVNNFRIGNLLSTFAPLIGSSFSKTAVTSDLTCNQALNSNEISLHILFTKLTTKVFGELNYTISLFDIPAMITSGMPRYFKEYTSMDMFAYTFCNHGSNISKIARYVNRENECRHLWMKPITGEGPLICKPSGRDYEQEGCCHFFAKVLGPGSLPRVMSIMRFAMPRTKTKYPLQELMNNFNLEIGQHHLSAVRNEKLDDWRMINRCQYANAASNNKIVSLSCDLFSAVPTSMGICHAFNAPHIVKVNKILT